MTRQAISPAELVVSPHDQWCNQWLLLTCGDFAAGHYNAMTVGWGMFGTMWGKPVAITVVRPQRYTLEFMEQYDTFTLCGFPSSCVNALQLLGTKSGRDGDKITESGLTPEAASQVASPVYAEADLVIECRKIYWQDIDPDHFLDPTIDDKYPKHDYHRAYWGEMVAVAKG